MISAFTSPILVPAEGSELALERIALSGRASTEAYSEKWLQDLLYRHPAALPVGEIDGSLRALRPLCQEMSTPAGPIDVVYVTDDGTPVLVEAKLWRNPEARRKVVGQILDYAKELTQWDFEKFDAAVRRARHREDHGSAKGVLELVGTTGDASRAASFHDSLTRKLRRGELLLLIVGDGIREGVGAIAEFLERQASLHFTFGLVEMAIYRMPDGRGQLVQPRVLAQSTIVRRTVIELRQDSMRVVEEDNQTPDDEGTPELQQSRTRFETFWRGFLKELHLDDKRQAMGPPSRAQNHFLMMPKETGAWVSAFVAESQHRAGVYLTFYKGPIANRFYAALYEDKAAIERELGIPVNWASDGIKHLISSSKTFEGAFVDDDPIPIQRTLADWTNRYVNVFRPRLEKLAREA